MSGSTTKRNGKRDSFRSRKRFHRSTFVPGGSKEDPLNIETQLSETCQNEIIEEIEKPCERPIKKKKYDQDNHEKNKKCHSPTKRGDHGSPRRHEKKHPNKQEQEAAENRKAKKEYFNKKYRFGNFDRYYGIRLNPGENDKRLTVFQKEWFEKKSILDIGCNVGFLTLSIAKEFSPRRILGIDIDDHLIGVARKNIRHYCDHEIPMIGKYPASFASTFGPVTPAVTEPRSFSTKFPDNVWFKKENYILESDDLLELVEEEFDVILALSITKWIHLNWGDDGMRRFLQRAFKHLMPGGKLIIEPQPFESYRKRAKMMDELMGNYEKIEFKPDDFEMYLLEEIGFETVDHLGAPSAKSKGFERYIDVYTKPLKTDKNEGQKKS